MVELTGGANHLKTGGDIADQPILLDDELGGIEAVAQRKNRVGVRHGTLLGYAKKGWLTPAPGDVLTVRLLPLGYSPIWQRQVLEALHRAARAAPPERALADLGP